MSSSGDRKFLENRGKLNARSSPSPRRRSNDIAPAQGPRVLVLPFGKGALSITMLVTLRRIMVIIASEEGLDSPPLPCDYFDLICGAGLGGLFALLLGRLRMSVDEILDWVSSDVRWVYNAPRTHPIIQITASKFEQPERPKWMQKLGAKPSYDYLWKRCILELLSSHSMDDKPFYSPQSCRTCILTSAVASTQFGTGFSVNRFRSYHLRNHSDSDVSIREVAWATVMDVSNDIDDETPLPAVALPIGGKQHYAAKRRDCDPDREAFDEMRHIWDELNDSCYVEIRSMRKEQNKIEKVYEYILQNRDAVAQFAGEESSRLPRMHLGPTSTTHIYNYKTSDKEPNDFSEFDMIRNRWRDGDGTAFEIERKVMGDSGSNSLLACAWRLIRPRAPKNNSPSTGALGIQKGQEHPDSRFTSQPVINSGGSLFDIKYFTTESEPGADKFFRELEDGALAYLGALKAGEEKIRVAILDTGINIPGYPELQGACIGEAKPFGEFQNCDDEDGHGSLIAAMVNRVNPNVELAIAKVFRNSEDVNNQSVARIKDALKWAIFEKRVHIISMSFGFAAQPKDPELRHLLVEDAHNEGVLLFAAASNDGANGPIPFPANLREHVFSINSADAYGNPAKYATVRDKHGYNFTAIGNGVRGLQGLSEDEPPRTVCGSSIATPIAAGIASLILEFTGKNGVKMDNISTLRTYQGMAKILVRSSREKYGFLFLSPNKLLCDKRGNHKKLGHWIDYELGDLE